MAHAETIVCPKNSPAAARHESLACGVAPRPINQWLLAAMCCCLLAVAASGAHAEGVWVPAFPSPSKTVDLSSLTRHDVYLIFDVEDTNPNRDKLQKLLANIPEEDIKLTAYGEFGRTVSSAYPPTGSTFKNNPIGSMVDPITKKKLLHIWLASFNQSTTRQYRDIGRVIAVNFQTSRKAADFPLLRIAVERTIRQPESFYLYMRLKPEYIWKPELDRRSQLTPQQLNDPKENNNPKFASDPEVKAWTMAWRHDRATLEGFANHFKLDPTSEKTRQAWERYISDKRWSMTFTLFQGAKSYESDSGIKLSLYDDQLDFPLQPITTELVGDLQYDKLPPTAKSGKQKVMEGLWNMNDWRTGRAVSRTIGREDVIGHFYATKEMRGEPLRGNDSDYEELVVSSKITIGYEQTASVSSERTSTESVGASAGGSFLGIELGGELGYETTSTFSHALSRTVSAQREQSVQTTRKILKGSLYLVSVRLHGTRQVFERGGYEFQRYIRIRQGEPVYDAFAVDDGTKTLMRYKNTARAGQAATTQTELTGEVDPEQLRVLDTLNTEKLGNRHPLAGRWQGIDLDDGEMRFYIVGGDGKVYDEVEYLKNRTWTPDKQLLALNKGEVTGKFLDENTNQPWDFKAKIFKDRDDRIERLEIRDRENQLVGVWYRNEKR